MKTFVSLIYLIYVQRVTLCNKPILSTQKNGGDLLIVAVFQAHKAQVLSTISSGNTFQNTDLWGQGKNYSVFCKLLIE